MAGAGRLGAVAGLVVAVLALGAGAHAAPSASVQAVLDASKQASGGARWDSVRNIETVGAISGRRGVLREVEDVRRGRYVTHEKVDGEDAGQGFDGKTYWTVDGSGEVRIEGGASRALALNAAYRARHGYWRSAAPGEKRERLPDVSENGRVYDVVRLTPEGGAPFTLWFDRRTHLVARMVEDRAPYVEIERYADYRLVHGVKVPFATEISNGDSRFNHIVHVTRVTLLSNVTDAAFAPPPPPPPDYAFPAGADHVDVPFELWNNHVYIKVAIGSAPPRLMMFDTGATGLMDAGAAVKFGLKPKGASAVMGSGAKTLAGGAFKVPELTVGGVRFRGLSFEAIDYSEQRKVEGVGASIGVIGYEIPKRLVTRIDYAHHVLTLTKPAAARPPEGATALDFEFMSQLVVVTAAVDGKPGRFAIDTGSRASVLLLSDFVQRNGFEKTIPATERLFGWGLGGPVKAQVGHAQAFDFGGFVVPRPAVGLLPPGPLPPVDGNIGGGILKRFDVTFDYAHQKIWLKPNAALDTPDRVDLSGLWINQDPDGFRIVDVEPGSAAATAGLKVDDVIVAANGAPAATLLLSDVRDRLKQPGAVETLTIRNASGRRTVELRLPAE